MCDLHVKFFAFLLFQFFFEINTNNPQYITFYMRNTSWFVVIKSHVASWMYVMFVYATSIGFTMVFFVCWLLSGWSLFTLPIHNIIVLYSFLFFFDKWAQKFQPIPAHKYISVKVPICTNTHSNHWCERFPSSFFVLPFVYVYMRITFLCGV